MIALSLGFTVIRVLFRFLIESILFRVLSDKVFFESSDIGSSSSGSAVIDSSLHQCSFSAMSLFLYQIMFPADNYMFKVNNRNTTTRCERRHWRRSGIFIVNFQHISHLVLVFPLLTLSRSMPAGLLLFKSKRDVLFFIHYNSQKQLV